MVVSADSRLGGSSYHRNMYCLNESHLYILIACTQPQLTWHYLQLPTGESSNSSIVHPECLK